MERTCELCGKPWTGKGKKCNTCKSKLAREKGSHIEPKATDEMAIEVPTENIRAVYLEVDVSLPFSKQAEQAMKLSKKARHNTRAGKDEWVIPGRCKHGMCLNPNCPNHKKSEEVMLAEFLGGDNA